MNHYRWSLLLLLVCVAVPSALSACSSGGSTTSAAAGSAGTLTEAEAGASAEGGSSGEAGSSPLAAGGSAAGGEAGAPSFGGIGGTFVGGSSGAANGGGGVGGAPLCSGLPATTACTTMSDGYTTCDETTGSSYASASAKADLKAGCTSVSGTFTTACPTRGVYGRCITECGQADESITYYYDARAGDAGKSTCEHEGSTWDGP